MANRPPRVPHGRGTKSGSQSGAKGEDTTLPDAARAPEGAGSTGRGAGSGSTGGNGGTGSTEGGSAAGDASTSGASAASGAKRSGPKQASSKSAASKAFDAARAKAAPGRPGGKPAQRGTAARSGRGSVEDRQRRLRERQALVGAIREQVGAAARPGGDTERAHAPVPARALSTRVIALALILIVSGFMLFPAVTTFVRQQGELHQAQAGIEREQATQDALQAELKRWDDPEYVKQQARARIGQAEPGEKVYVVKGKPVATDSEGSVVKPGEYRQGLPWGDGVWDSVLRAATP